MPDLIYSLLNTVQSSCPVCRKAPVLVSIPELQSWDDVLGTSLILLLPPNTASGIYTKKVLFWSHVTTGPSPMPPLVRPDGHWQTSCGSGQDCNP